MRRDRGHGNEVLPAKYCQGAVACDHARLHQSRQQSRLPTAPRPVHTWPGIARGRGYNPLTASDALGANLMLKPALTKGKGLAFIEQFLDPTAFRHSIIAVFVSCVKCHMTLCNCLYFVPFPLPTLRQWWVSTTRKLLNSHQTSSSKVRIYFRDYRVVSLHNYTYSEQQMKRCHAPLLCSTSCKFPLHRLTLVAFSLSRILCISSAVEGAPEDLLTLPYSVPTLQCYM